MKAKIPSSSSVATAVYLHQQTKDALTNDDVARLKGMLEPLSAEDRELAVREANLLLELQDVQGKLRVSKDTFNRMMPEFAKNWLEVVRRSKLVQLPPSAKSPINVETIMMAQGYCLEPVTHLHRDVQDDQIGAQRACLMMAAHMAPRTPSLAKIRNLLDEMFDPHTEESIAVAHRFAVNWMRSGFAKLEIGHKLCAALALTDVPDDVEVRAPWDCWSLVVPPGVFGDTDQGDEIARVWCEGAEPRFFIGSHGGIMGPVTRDMIYREDAGSHGRAVAVALDCLVRSACVALSNPDDYRKSSAGSSSGSSGKQRRGSSGAPDFGATRFMLNAPVEIDMRDRLRAVIRGETRAGGGSPQAQFLVRGHWRNQAHGPHRALRKQLWIKPFWKGDESTRVLLRNYTVKS